MISSAYSISAPTGKPYPIRYTLTLISSSIFLIYIAVISPSKVDDVDIITSVIFSFFILSINAVPILAHPLLNLTPNELTEFLPLAKQRGLVGMECKYCLYNDMEEKFSIDMANRFNLKCSGGSDFHGSIKPDIQLGVGKGNLKIPYEWYLNLKQSSYLV